MLSCPSNESYGHAEVYRDYANTYSNINGRIQHGWSALGASVMVGDYLDKRGCKFFVWSDKWAKYGYTSMKDLVTMPKDRTFVVGAPILYVDVPKQTATKSTLAAPSHSLYDAAISVEAWKEYCAFVKAYDNNASVLMHYRDIELGYDKAIKDMGLSVVTAGHVRSYDFLARLISIVSSYESVLSNCVQTICFYALWLNKYVKIAGPATPTSRSDATDARNLDWIKQNYPSLLKGTCDASLVDVELGHKLSPDEIKRIMF